MLHKLCDYNRLRIVSAVRLAGGALSLDRSPILCVSRTGKVLHLCQAWLTCHLSPDSHGIADAQVV